MPAPVAKELWVGRLEPGLEVSLCGWRWGRTGRVRVSWMEKRKRRVCSEAWRNVCARGAGHARKEGREGGRESIVLTCWCSLPPSLPPFLPSVARSVQPKPGGKKSKSQTSSMCLFDACASLWASVWLSMCTCRVGPRVNEGGRGVVLRALPVSVGRGAAQVNWSWSV